MTIYALLSPETYPVAVSEVTGLSTILFNNGPFYLSTLTVSFIPTGSTTSVPLTLGVDYEPILLFNAATSVLSTPVYGGIGIVNIALVGVITVQYAKLGLGYGITPIQLAEINANPAIELYTSLWENVIPNYVTFPEIPLVSNIETQYSISSVNAKIDDITSSLTTLPAHLSVFNFNNHIAATDNPHLDNAVELGISNIPNWTIGIATDVISATGNKFVTPAAIAGAVNVVVPKATSSNLGVVELNLGGGGAEDGIDASKVLTAAGLETLLLSGNLNVTPLTNNQQTVARFSPFPIPYPITWNGVVCNNFADLLNQVQIATGISPLSACAKTGEFYFPNRFNLTGFVGLNFI